MAGGRVLFFSAPCGFSKTALAEALLRGQDVLHLSAGDEGLALPPADGRWRVLLLDDLQNMQDENDWNALCELIRSGSDRRFVLLSHGVPPGCLIAFRYSEMEKYYRSLPEAEIAASPALMQGMSMLCALAMDYEGSERWYHEFSVENGASSYALFRLQSAGGRPCTAATSRTVRPI